MSTSSPLEGPCCYRYPIPLFPPPIIHYMRSLSSAYLPNMDRVMKCWVGSEFWCLIFIAYVCSKLLLFHVTIYKSPFESPSFSRPFYLSISSYLSTFYLPLECICFPLSSPYYVTILFHQLVCWSRSQKPWAYHRSSILNLRWGFFLL